MKLPKLILFAVLATVIVACHRQTPAEKPHNPNTPEPLQDGVTDGSFSLISKYRDGDLVDEIYRDLLEKRPELKKLEDDIAASHAMQNDSLSKYHKYEVKSTLYYQAANLSINTITDSVLKRQMQAIITASSKGYAGRIAVIYNMINGLGKKDTMLNNYHTALKLLVTLPIMEKFQADEIPNDKILHVLTKEKNELIDRSKKLIPKNN